MPRRGFRIADSFDGSAGVRLRVAVREGRDRGARGRGRHQERVADHGEDSWDVVRLRARIPSEFSSNKKKKKNLFCFTQFSAHYIPSIYLSAFTCIYSTRLWPSYMPLFSLQWTKS